MQVKAKLTFGDLEQMPENGKRYELHEGEVFVTAAPRVDHQDVCLALGGLLRRVLKPRGRIYLGVDAYFTETTVYIPDVVFIRRENFGRITRRFVHGAPDLVVEVTYPSTEAYDRGVKFQDYARYGVPEYWLVDPGEKSAEVYVLREKRYELFGRFAGNETLRSAQFDEVGISLAEIWPEELAE